VIDQIKSQIVAVLEQDHPQTLRHVYYRMTDPRLPVPIQKTDNGYDRIRHYLHDLRRDGIVPYDYVVDSSRVGIFVPRFNNAADFLRAYAGSYRADIWADRPRYCQVWVESRSLAGVLEDLCWQYAVDLYPCGGFASLSFVYEAAKKINREHDGRELVIYYIGDYDPAGVLIDVALEQELREHLHPDVKLQFLRLGITEQQVARYRLPTKTRKASDPRAPHVKWTVEAEAMPAATMRGLISGAIAELLPADALERAAKKEARERRKLLSWIK
jgi:hypothetical protein